MSELVLAGRVHVMAPQTMINMSVSCTAIQMAIAVVPRPLVRDVSVLVSDHYLAMNAFLCTTYHHHYCIILIIIINIIIVIIIIIFICLTI
jgi:hypothetical protein